MCPAPTSPCLFRHIPGPGGQRRRHGLKLLIDHLPLAPFRRFLLNLLDRLLANHLGDAGVDPAPNDLPSAVNPSKEAHDLLSQASVEVGAGLPLLVLNPRRLSPVKPEFRELNLALLHNPFALGLLDLVSREAVGGGGDVTPKDLSSTLFQECQLDGDT